ncbi:MAG: ankyrin repeat domain-containing protein [Pyrinomonadaceae bacterium]
MSDLRLCEAVKNGESAALKGLIAAGADVNEQDEHGWTPLCWAAGVGDAEAARQLLEHGADVFKTGRDQRTPYMIALAGHREMAELLREAEDRAGGGRVRPGQEYCRAYTLGELRRFPGWPAGAEAPDEEVLYLHHDFTVTRSIWHGEDIVFDEVSPEWREFCSGSLEFKAPDDLDYIAPAGGGSSGAQAGSAV